MYSLMFVNNNWYLFFRLHHILCERLHKISQQAARLAEDEAKCKRDRKESTAIALRLKAPSEFPVLQHFSPPPLHHAAVTKNTRESSVAHYK